MPEFAFQFWKRVDELREGTSLKKICEDLDIKYTRMRDNRSDNRYPNREDMIRLAKYLNTTVDYLMTGTPGTPSIQSSSFDYVEDAMTKDSILADIIASLIKQIKGEK